MKTRWNAGLFVSRLVIAGFAAVGVTATSAVAAGQAEPHEQVTFAKDIAPILQRSCENCHRVGGGAPMPLVTYKEVRPWARSIKQRTLAREMPPWFIDKNIGIQRFKDDPSLSDEETGKIATWVDSGAPRGNPADMPAPRQWPEGGWSIGEPDLVVSSPEFTIEAIAADYWGPFSPPFSPTGLTEDRYIKSVEIKEVILDLDGDEKPTAQRGTRAEDDGRADLNLFVVHHAVITAATETEEEPVESGGVGRPGLFGIVHELGQNATVFPDHVGVVLPADSILTYENVHLHAIGKKVRARVDTAFTLHARGYEPKYLQSTAAQSGAFELELDIPAGETNTMRDGFYVVTRPSILMTFEPHLHSSGTRMCIEAVYPNNFREMLNCAGYNHNWVKVYAYEDDVAPLLPTGTVLHIMGWYDNSPTNSRVVDPRNWKGWGNRSIDDMLYHLPRMIYLTEEEFEAEVAARGRRQNFATSQNQQ